MSNGGWLPRCILCKQSISLEQCKTDEYGRAVHEECYVSLLLVQKKLPTTVKLVPKKPPKTAKAARRNRFSLVAHLVTAA
jgi:hypothetical protein